MKTKADAAKTLLKSGWASKDVQRILGVRPEIEPAPVQPQSPGWWHFIQSDGFMLGVPSVNAWAEWVEQQK